MSICLMARDLIIPKYLLYWALCDCSQGEFSKTIGPLVVVQKNGKYLLVDGYHRLIELMLTWKSEFLCEIQECDVEVNASEEVFKHESDKEYGGLEIFMDKNCIDDIVCQMRKN